MTEETQTQKIFLDDNLLKEIENRLQYTQFDSKRDYIEYFLEELLFEISENTDNLDAMNIEEEEVQNRLKSLGYLNE